MAAGIGNLLLVGLEIEVEMRQRVVLDLARGGPQRIEFRQGVAGAGTTRDKAASGVLQRALQIGVGKGGRRIGFEGVRGWLHGVKYNQDGT